LELHPSALRIQQEDLKLNNSKFIDLRTTCMLINNCTIELTGKI
jgi:hypothetical protein